MHVQYMYMYKHITINLGTYEMTNIPNDEHPIEQQNVVYLSGRSVICVFKDGLF